MQTSSRFYDELTNANAKALAKIEKLAVLAAKNNSEIFVGQDRVVYTIKNHDDVLCKGSTYVIEFSSGIKNVYLVEQAADEILLTNIISNESGFINSSEIAEAWLVTNTDIL